MKHILLNKEKKELLIAILVLAWPTMLEQLMQTIVQYIDVAMVGSLGTSATAAVGSTTTINWLVNGSVSALGIGFMAIISQARGANDYIRAKKASAQSVIVALVVGVISTILTLGLSKYIPIWMRVDKSIQTMASSYFFVLYAPMLFRAAILIFGSVLRAAGDSKTPMLSGILVNIINIVLNFFFIYPTREITILSKSICIYGAGLGVVGAALASAIAFVIGGICISIALWKHKEISPNGMTLKPDGMILRPCMKIAVPNMFQRFASSLGYVFFATMINSLGEVSVAAHTIANTVESAFYIPGYGMMAAAATLTGNALGARDKKRMKDLSHMMIFIEVALMVVSGTFLFIFAPTMVSLFTKSKEVIDLGSIVLRMVAVSEPLYGVTLIIEGMMQGVGKTMQAFIYNIIGMWGIRIVGTFICIHLLGMGLISAWSCMIFHNIMLFIMFFIYYLNGKWNKF